MASREDNLLNKLKSCIGSLPSQPPPVPVTAYQSTHVRSQLNSSLSYQKRQTQERMLRSKKEFEFGSMSVRQNINDVMQTERGAGDALKRERNQKIVLPSRQAFSSMENIDLRHKYSKYSTQNKINPHIQIKQQLTSRYSLEKSAEELRFGGLKKPFPPSANNATKHPSNELSQLRTVNYQSESQKRKDIISSIPPSRNIEPPSKTRELPSRNRAESSRTRIESSRPREEPLITRQQPSEIRLSSGTQVKERGRVGLGTGRGGMQGECSALQKLRKISDLNEKINQRIRNIITVFEEHK